jgi:two-component system sensor histidine kinase GlrK
MFRRLLSPRSTLSLILVAFGVVALPLFLALGVAGFHIERIADQGQTTVRSATEAIRGSSRLTQALNGLERSARQYLLLNEQAILESYRDRRRAFQATVDDLGEHMAGNPVRESIRTLGRRESELYGRLSHPRGRQQLDQRAIAQAFSELRELASEIQQGSRVLIDREVSWLEETATAAKAWLLWMGAALIPLTLISSALFTALISRPIRQLDQAIRRLGDTGFDQRIAINGPEDLQALGERLEWLRLRLKELENEKARFLRHVSHELKTPLTAIRESGELLHSETSGQLNTEQREITGILNDSGRRLQGLIENLLDFARTHQSQRRPLALSEVDLPTIVKAVLRDHQPEMRAKELRVRTQLRRCELNADETKLKTILDNLISNAVKFSPQKGQLTLTSVSSNNWAVLTVADEGPGIPAHERSRIFQAFVQGEANSGGEVKGSGLGLSIVREYVRAHGGYISVADNEGHGTHIRVELPLQPRNQEKDANAD